MSHAISEAERLGHQAILLVGDAPYYGRFGFSADKTGQLSMPGPYERHRFLALELVAGALDDAAGTLKADRPQDQARPGSPRPPEKPLCHNDLERSADQLAERHGDRHVAFDLDLAGHEGGRRAEIAGDQILEIARATA